MALHSLTGDSRVGNVGRRPVVEPSSKGLSNEVATSNTGGVTVNSRHISAKPNVQVVLDSKSGMVVKPTSQAYGRGFHVSAKSIVNTFVIGLALLSGKAMAEPCDSSKTYLKSAGCGVDSSTVGACDIQDELFVPMGNTFNTSAVEYGNCTASNGDVFSLLRPNFLDIENATEAGFTCANWQLLNDTMRQTIQSGDGCDANLLKEQCFYWTNYLFSQFLNPSQCEYLTNAPTPSPTANAVSNGSSESSDFKLAMELIIFGIFLLDFLGWGTHFSSFGQKDTVPELDTDEKAKDHLLQKLRIDQNDEVVNEVGLNGVLKKFSQSRTSKAMHLAYRLKNYGKLGVAVGMLVELNRLNDRQTNAELFAAYLLLDGLSSIFQKTVFDMVRFLQQLMIGCCSDLEGFDGLKKEIDPFEFFKKTATGSNYNNMFDDVNNFFEQALNQNERDAIAQISNRYPFVEFNDRYKLLKLALPDLVNYIPYALLIHTDESKGLLTPLISAGVTSLISKVGKFYARQDGLAFQFLKMAKLKLDKLNAPQASGPVEMSDVDLESASGRQSCCFALIRGFQIPNDGQEYELGAGDEESKGNSSRSGQDGSQLRRAQPVSECLDMVDYFKDVPA